MTTMAVQSEPVKVAGHIKLFVRAVIIPDTAIPGRLIIASLTKELASGLQVRKSGKLPRALALGGTITYQLPAKSAGFQITIGSESVGSLEVEGSFRLHGLLGLDMPAPSVERPLVISGQLVLEETTGLSGELDFASGGRSGGKLDLLSPLPGPRITNVGLVLGRIPASLAIQKMLVPPGFWRFLTT